MYILSFIYKIILHFQGTESYDLLVSNLPDEKDIIIKRRLKQLSENCGGRVMEIHSSTAVVRFTSKNSADRYIDYSNISLFK